jgi:hypothetical protein
VNAARRSRERPRSQRRERRTPSGSLPQGARGLTLFHVTKFWKDPQTAVLSADACPSCRERTTVQLRYAPVGLHLTFPFTGHPLWYRDRVDVAVCMSCGLWGALFPVPLARFRSGFFRWREWFLFDEIAGQLLGTAHRISPKNGYSFLQRTTSLPDIADVHAEFEGDGK